MVNIVDVQAVHPRPDEAPPGWRRWLGQVAVRVDTDEGICGYGVGAGGVAATTIINELLRPGLVGQACTPIEDIWRFMYRATMPYGRKGLAVMALSGVDLALWDIHAKSADVPVVVALGGEPETELAVYRTASPDPVLDAANGFGAFKLAVPGDWGIDEVVREVSSARAALGGDVTLMIDVGMRWSLEGAIEAVDRLAPLDLAWIEEPLPPDDLDAYARLVARSPVPIAGGEHEYTTEGFARILEAGAHDIVQPDVTWCGGMSVLAGVYELAAQFDVEVCPHRGGEAWAAHAVAAYGGRHPAEEPRPWLTWVDGQPPMGNGRMRISNAPGFGVDLSSLPWG